MIRQAISCDICGAEKKQTNHWFVAYEQAGELRVSGWSTRNRQKPGAKHLCGQTCLHKLADDFMARSIAVRTQPSAAPDEAAEKLPAATDTSLTSAAAYGEIESSARLLTPVTPPAPLVARAAFRAPAELVTMPARNAGDEYAVPLEEPPRYATRNWRAEAWERERERELRAVEGRPDIVARRMSQA